MTFLRRLALGCWFTHGAMLRERERGRYVIRCEICGYAVPFPKQKLKAKRLNVVKGQFGVKRA